MKMKNRLIAGVLCLLMVLSCVSGLTSCNDEHDHDHDTCSHQWGEWSTTKAATCTDAGTKERTCADCGEKETSTISALGHDWNEATCSTPKTCKICSATEGSASAHAYTVETVKDEALKSAATCTSAAVYYKSCSCGAIGTNDADTFTSGSPAAHSYTVETVKDEALKSAATTESAAVYYKSCACGAISTNDADTFTHGVPIGHTHSFTLETVKDDALKAAASCENAAVYFKSCSCGAVSTNEADTFTSGSALGHKDEGKDHICDNGCGKTDMGACSDSDNDNDHVCDYGCKKVLNDCSDATGDNNHSCDVCGKENVSAHDFGNATCGTPATCSECGAQTGTTAAHIYNRTEVKTEALKSAATCTSAAVYYKSCSCGAISTNDVETFTSGDALGHKDEGKDHICDNGCGKTDMGEHTDSENDNDHVCDYGCGVKISDCTDKANDGNHACDVCGAADVTEHSYGDATCSAPKTCSECGATSGTNLDHIDADHDHVCDNLCGKNDMGLCADSPDDDDHVCDYGCKKVLNNCSDVNDDADHACDVCGKADVTTHTYNEDTSKATAADCDSAATKTFVCNCGHEDIRKVGGELGHDITGVQAEERHTDGCAYVLVYICKRPGCGEEVTGETVYHHTYVASIDSPATCVSSGTKTFKCSDCGDTSKPSETIPADSTGHVWVKGEAANGERTDTCSVCSATKTVIDYSNAGATGNISASDLADKEIALNDANISLDSGAIGALNNKDVSVSAGKLEGDERKDLGLTEEQLEEQVGDSPIYNFTITSGTETISEFGENSWVTVTLPYELAPGEDVDSIAIWFISSKCEVEDCPNGDACTDNSHKLVSMQATYNNGYVTFKTNHFSYYTVTRLTPAERCALYDHGWAEQVVVGSCTEDAYTLKVCVRCHAKQIKEGTFVGADGHNYQVVETVEATCTTAGYVTYKCTDCDDTYTERSNANGHSWSLKASADATCTADGYETYSCANCSEEYTITSAKLAHVYTNTVVSATCTADGYTVHDCDNCDYNYTDAYVNALGHEYESTTWAWASDYSAATLAFVCEHDNEHVIVLDATVQKTVVNGTCSNFVKTTYTAIVSYNNTDYTDAKIVEAGTPDHNFSSDWTKGENEHWHECVCGEKSDVTAHTFENATITKQPTCAEAGESTAYCVCGATKVTSVPATGDHTYENGVCTVCGKEFVNDYYVQLLNSWKNIDGFAIKIQDLSYEVKEKDDSLLESFKLLGSVKQIDIAELALYVEDGELGGAAIGTIVIFNGPISNADAVYKFKAVIHEGYVYINVEYGKDVADKTLNIKLTVDSVVESMLEEMDIEGETVYVLEFFTDTLIPAVDTLVELNSEDANAILEDMFNMIFTFEKQADGSYIATLDYDKLYALNENLATKPVAEVIDLYFGEGAFDSVVDLVLEILGLEPSEIPAYLDAKGLNSADLIAKINELAKKTGAPEDYDIMDMLNDEELAGMTLGMLIFEVEDNSYVDSINEVVAEFRKTTLYDMIDPDSATEIKDGVDAILDMIVDSVSLSFATDADGMLTKVDIDVDSFTYSDGENEIFLNFSLEIVINGRIEVTWSDIIESIENGIVEPEDDMLDGEIYSDYDYGWGGFVEYQGKEYNYNNGVRIRAYKPLYDQLAYVIYYPDCSGWMEYEQCYAEQVYEFILAQITVDGESVMLLIDEYSGEVVGLIPTETGFTAIYEDGSEKAIAFDMSADYENPADAYTAVYLAVFKNPEGYINAFGEYVSYYYNAELQQYATETHHEYEYEYEIHGDCCDEDGCTVRTTCKNCDYYDEHTRYWCEIESEVEIDLSEHSSCGGTIVVDRCSICGHIRYVYDTDINCNMGEGVEEDILDENGTVIGTKYSSTCTKCGLVFVEQEWVEAHSACEWTEYEGMYIYKGETCIFAYVDEWFNDDHQYEYTYGLKGTTCEEGYIVSYYCTVCGKTETWHSSGHRNESFEMDMSEFGCEGMIRGERCPICKEITYIYHMDLGCNTETEEEPEQYVDEEGISHYVSNVTCPDCGLKFIIETWSIQISVCETRSYRKTQIYQSENLIIDNLSIFGAVRHQYEETYEMDGATCEDGYYVTRYCSICQQTERYHTNGHRYEYREVDLSEFGLCGGWINEEYCPVCNTVLYSNANERCCWEFVEETEDGYSKYQCCDCGAIRLSYSHDSEKNENCQYVRTVVRIYMVKGEEVYRYEYTQTREDHDYEYEFKMNGDSCEDGYTIITTCKNCDIRWTEECDWHNEIEKDRIDLEALGACYGEFVYYSCACGERSGMNLNACCYEWTDNEYYDEENGRMVYVQTATCPECGLRYTRSYYVVEDATTCTATYYYSIVISIGDTLAAERQYTEVQACHSGKTTATLKGGEGSSCEDGVIITYKCDRCDYEDSYEVDWHETIEKEIIDLSEIGCVCGGYAFVYECACGEQGHLSLDHSLCDWGTEGSELWIEDAITDGQYTINGYEHIWNSSYMYICAVTDPEDAACAFKIRYAYYWLKEAGECRAYEYEIWQFGYNEETGEYLCEVKYKTGNSRIYHNYNEDDPSDDDLIYDCPDCGSYYHEIWTHDGEFCTKYERIVLNTLCDEDDKYSYYERVDEYALDANGNSYVSREYRKRISPNGEETWSENLRTEEEYIGSFGDPGRKVVCNYTNSDGASYKEEYAYVYYKGYDFREYEYVEEGGQWYRYDYTYTFVGGCVKTSKYADSEGNSEETKEDVCRFYQDVTIKQATCSQDGEMCHECVVCGKHSESFTVDAHDHDWVEVTEGWYCCFRCGLENANGASGDIIMEDLTEKYGNDENYVVGYYVRNDVDFTMFVALVWDDGREEIVEGLEFWTIDGVRAYAFSKAAVEAWANEKGFEDYKVKFSFVPVGSDSSFDYGVTFTETMHLDTITDDVSFVDYVSEGAWVSYTITPSETGAWTFTSDTYFDTYAELCDAEGNVLTGDDDSGEEANFLISYELTAGESYTIRVKWLDSSKAGTMSLIFAKEAKTE